MKKLEGRRAKLLAEYTARTGVKPDEENQGTVDCVLGLWDQGVELSHYTSAASAADTVDLMQALTDAQGYAGYNLYGISYGTRLAETIMRDFADTDLVRTITFDSVFPRPVGEFDAACTAAMGIQWVLPSSAGQTARAFQQPVSSWTWQSTGP